MRDFFGIFSLYFEYMLTMAKCLSIAILITGFLVGNAYGASEAYYCSDTGSGGFVDYDKKSGLYSHRLMGLDRYKMKLDKDSGFIQLFIDSLPLEAPIEMRKPKFYCRYRPEFPQILNCQSGLEHFDFNTENGKYVRSHSTSILFQGFHISITFGTCEKF